MPPTKVSEIQINLAQAFNDIETMRDCHHSAWGLICMNVGDGITTVVRHLNVLFSTLSNQRGLRIALIEFEPADRLAPESATEGTNVIAAEAPTVNASLPGYWTLARRTF